MADIADPRLADDLGRDAVLAHRPRQLGRDLGDGAILARADVERAARRLRQHQRIGEGARHIRDVHEIAALPAILEDHRLLAVEQARGEDRKHARIGIGERLARPVDVEQAQAHAFHPIGRRHDVRRALLHIFVERVDRGEIRPLPLGRGDRGQRTALRIDRLPVGQPVAQALALGIFHVRAVRVMVEAFAIDAHRRGGDDAAHRLIDQCLEQHGGAHIVGRGITLHLVHRLADAHLGRQVDHAVDIF